MSDYEKILMLINAKQNFGVANPYNNDFITNENLAKFLVENGVMVCAEISKEHKVRKRYSKKKYIGE